MSIYKGIVNINSVTGSPVGVIIAEKINIKDKNWKLSKVIVTDINNFSNKLESLTLSSNFDLEKINNLIISTVESKSGAKIRS